MHTLVRFPAFLDTISDIDQYLQDFNSELDFGEEATGSARINSYYRYQSYKKGFPGRFSYFFSFLYHRVFAKLHPVTRKLYLKWSGGKAQRISKTEVLGRLIRSGFKILSANEEKGELRFLVEKIAEPDAESKPSFWPLFKMRRVGKHGSIIYLYKLRTMHSYAEFVQDYIRENNGLDETGKFSNDFRVTSWGRVFRKYWIDELPMFINLVKGDIKWIGVRPISKSYLQLYPIEFREYRNQFKPGLIPPYYADMPKSLPEIVLSEKNYFEKYEKSPAKTDLQYLFRILGNVIFRKARSK